MSPSQPEVTGDVSRAGGRGRAGGRDWAGDDARAARSAPMALLVAVRPRQWIKNVLVFAAPGAAGVLTEGPVLWRTAVAFVCFCAVSAGTYLLNDAGDVEADRAHPTKRGRPIAAGELGLRTARVLGIGLLAGGVALGLVVRWQLVAVLAGYVVLTTAYTLWLKHEPVLDIVAVAAGFVLRAIAGGAATDVPISDWFFIVTSFGSLFMVAGKRGAESMAMGVDGATVRRTLGSYSDSFLAYLRSVSSGVVLIAYCLWAFEKANAVDVAVPWFQMSIVPFAAAILRYAQLLDAGEGSAPEELVLSDVVLAGIGVVWVIVFGIGVTVG